MGNRFNTAAGIACQFSAEQGKDYFSYHFSDESKFNLFRSHRKHFVWQQTEERLKPKCIKKSVKGGGGGYFVNAILLA